MSQASAAGDTFTPTMINLVCFWGWQIPLAWFLAFRAGFGPNGIFLAIAIAQATLAVIAITVFRRGKWKGKTI